MSLAISITLLRTFQLANGASFENPDPPPWTAYSQYYHLGALLLPPLIIALMIDRRKMLAGAAVGLLAASVMMWLNRQDVIPIGETLPEMKMVPGMVIEAFYVICWYALSAGLLGWLLRFVSRKRT